MSTRKPYDSDITDEEWAFVAPYLTLMTEEAPQRQYPLRETLNGLRWQRTALDGSHRIALAAYCQ